MHLQLLRHRRIFCDYHNFCWGGALFPGGEALGGGLADGPDGPGGGGGGGSNFPGN